MPGHSGRVPELISRDGKDDVVEHADLEKNAKQTQNKRSGQVGLVAFALDLFLM